MEQMSPDLYNQIIKRLNYERRLLSLKRKIFGYFVGFLASVVLFVPLFEKFREDFARSGLAPIVSLVFSDFKIVMSNFGDFVMSFLESIPAASLSLTLLALIALFFSLEKIFYFGLEWRDLRRLKI
jgi:hypothetical protein